MKMVDRCLESLIGCASHLLTHNFKLRMVALGLKRFARSRGKNPLQLSHDIGDGSLYVKVDGDGVQLGWQLPPENSGLHTTCEHTPLTDKSPIKTTQP